MASVNPPILVFTGGVIGGELHNRVDIQAYPTGAEVMENFRPRLQGPMTRRPPMLHVEPFVDSTKKGQAYEFLYDGNAAFLVLHTEDGFAFYLDHARLTIPSVTASLAGAWTNASTSPASITDTGPIVWLDSNGANPAVARKAITTSNVGILHVLAFEVEHGPINIRIGSTAGGRDLLHYTRLAAGIYRLAFTPDNTTAYLDFWHDDNAGRAIVDSVSILSGTTTYLLPTPYAEAAILALDREQIKDVMYFTHEDYWPRRLERRGTYSWSITKHLPGDGPWADPNLSSTTIAASNTQSEITLTASADLFTAADVGVLYKLTGSGQVRTASAAAADVATGGIKVTGSGAGDSTAVPPGSGGGGSTGQGDSGGGWDVGGGTNGG